MTMSTAIDFPKDTQLPRRVVCHVVPLSDDGWLVTNPLRGGTREQRSSRQLRRI